MPVEDLHLCEKVQELKFVPSRDQIGDIARINILVIAFRAKNAQDDSTFLELMDHFSRYKSFGVWPNKLAFEEYKWRAEFFLLSHETLLMLSREKASEKKSDLLRKIKLQSLLLFKNYLNNVQYQIEAFEKEPGQLYSEDLPDSKATARYFRYLGHYGCVNQTYPIGSLTKEVNKENLEKRLEYERFSHIKSRVKQKIEEAIELAGKEPVLANTCLSLKVARVNFENNYAVKFKIEHLEKLWHWEDIFSSSLYSSRPPVQQQEAGAGHLDEPHGRLRVPAALPPEPSSRPTARGLGQVQASGFGEKGRPEPEAQPSHAADRQHQEQPLEQGQAQTRTHRRSHSDPTGQSATASEVRLDHELLLLHAASDSPARAEPAKDLPVLLCRVSLPALQPQLLRPQPQRHQLRDQECHQPRRRHSQSHRQRGHPPGHRRPRQRPQAASSRPAAADVLLAHPASSKRTSCSSSARKTCKKASPKSCT